MTGPETALKRSKLKVISHALDVPGTCAPNVVGCLKGTCDGILRIITTFNGNKNFYDSFGDIPWLHHKIINR